MATMFKGAALAALIALSCAPALAQIAPGGGSGGSTTIGTVKQGAQDGTAAPWQTIIYVDSQHPNALGYPVYIAPATGATFTITGSVTATGSMSLTGTANVQGVTASGTTLTEYPLASGLRAATTTPTAVADGQKVNAEGDKYGRNINSPYAPVDLWVSGGGSKTDNTALTILSASGSASLREWLKTVHCGRSDAGTTAITVAISDGTKTRTIVIPNSGGGGGNNVTYDPPEPFAANTAVTATASTGVTTLYCDAQGFLAP